MDLYKEILIEILSNQKVNVTFDKGSLENPNEIIKNICYKTLEQIRSVLDDNKLDDFECIEKVVVLLEGIGSKGSSRHDFG